MGIPKHVLEAVDQQLLKSPRRGGGLNAVRMLKDIPTRAAVLGQLTWDDEPQPVRDLGDFLAATLTQTHRWPAIMFRRDDAHIGGIDFEVVKSMPERWADHCWYWPSDRVDLYTDVHRDPRYTSLRDAIVLSLQRCGDAAYVVARERGDFAPYEATGIRVRGWFNDSNYLADGSVQRWWQKQVAQMMPRTSPVLWRGSDDSMR